MVPALTDRGYKGVLQNMLFSKPIIGVGPYSSFGSTDELTCNFVVFLKNHAGPIEMVISD